MSGRYPGVKNLDEFWQKLTLGWDGITEIPAERWDWHQYYSPEKNVAGKSCSKWGGFLTDIDKFDSAFFNISPREAAKMMNPEERLMLENVWELLENSGYTPEKLQKSSENLVGVFIGTMWNEYQLLREGLDHPQGMFGLASISMIANRVSYYFNFQGPSLGVDTMCSSSLTALHLACDSLRRGETRYAIAGGVNLSLHPSKYLLLSELGFLSTNGRCCSFGEGGDGYVPSEGVGSVLLKPLKDALKDSDQILGVIRATAANHGGKVNSYVALKTFAQMRKESNKSADTPRDPIPNIGIRDGLTVPNPSAQTELIKTAMLNAKIKPEQINYIEAHGTGTKLGDPIEIIGLSHAFEGTKKQSCPIGSIKSNIGHMEGAAGIVALTKVLLQLQHKQLVPSIHSKHLNPFIDFKATPFFVQHKLSEWHPKPGELRRAGISSFGAGGSNIHVIVEEAPVSKISQTKPKPYYLLAFSAKQKESLNQKLEDLHQWLEKNPDSNLESIAYTLNCGRVHFSQYRTALIVKSIQELRDTLNGIKQEKQLKNYLLPRDEIKKLPTEPAAEIVQALMQKLSSDPLSAKKYRDLLIAIGDMYVQGYPIDWDMLHQGESRQIIPLPTYPFLRKKCWHPDSVKSITKTLPAVMQSDISQSEPVNQKIKLQALGTSIKKPRLSFISAAQVAIKTKQIRETQRFFALILEKAEKNSFIFTTNAHLENNICLQHQTKYGGYYAPLDIYLEIVYLVCDILFSDPAELTQIRLNKLKDNISRIKIEIKKESEEIEFNLFADTATENALLCMKGLIKKRTPLHTYTPPIYKKSIKVPINEPEKTNLGSDIYHTLQSLRQQNEDGIAILSPSPTSHSLTQYFLTHPTLTHGAIAATIKLMNDKNIYVPNEIETVAFYPPFSANEYRAYIHRVATNSNKISFNIDITDLNNVIVAKIDGLQLEMIKTIAAEQQPKAASKKGTANATIRNTVRKIVAETLFINEDEINDSQNFQELGIDSILGVEIAGKIKQQFKLPFEATVLYNYPTIHDLTQFITHQISHTAEEKPTVKKLIANNVKEDDNVLKQIRKIVAETLFIDESTLQDQQNFQELGVDSILGVEIVGKIKQAYHFNFEATELYNYPTVAELAQFITGQIKNTQCTPINVSWIRSLLVDTPQLDLFCFPCAGAGPALFVNWRQALPDSVGLRLIELPGREKRYKEKPETDAKKIVEEIVKAIIAIGPKHFVFFAHSLGTVIAFYVAKYLQQQRAQMPQILFLSAYPELKQGIAALDLLKKDLTHLSDDNLLKRFDKAGLSNIPNEVRTNQELLAEYVKVLRSDLSWKFNTDWFEQLNSEAPFTSTLVILAGDQDRFASLSHMKPWKKYTEGDFAEKEFNGNHFYLLDNAEAICKFIVDRTSQTKPST